MSYLIILCLISGVVSLNDSSAMVLHNCLSNLKKLCVCVRVCVFYCCLTVCLICPLKFGLRYTGSGNATQWSNTFVILKNTFLSFCYTPFVIIFIHKFRYAEDFSGVLGKYEVDFSYVAP